MWNVKQQKERTLNQIIFALVNVIQHFLFDEWDLFFGFVCECVRRSQSLNVRWSKSTKTEQRSKTLFFFYHLHVPIQIQLNSTQVLGICCLNRQFSNCSLPRNARVFRLMSLICTYFFRLFSFWFPLRSTLCICVAFCTQFHLLAFINHKHTGTVETKSYHRILFRSYRMGAYVWCVQYLYVILYHCRLTLIWLHSYSFRI